MECSFKMRIKSSATSGWRLFTMDFLAIKMISTGVTKAC